MKAKDVPPEWAKNYKNIQWPSDAIFWKMKNTEVKNFLTVLPAMAKSRIFQLEQVVNYSKLTQQQWNADFSWRSVESLGAWLLSIVEFERASDEMWDSLAQSVRPAHKLAAKLTKEHAKATGTDIDLAERTVSLAIDAGLYLCETSIAMFNDVSWCMPPLGKKNLATNVPCASNDGRDGYRVNQVVGWVAQRSIPPVVESELSLSSSLVRLARRLRWSIRRGLPDPF